MRTRHHLLTLAGSLLCAAVLPAENAVAAKPEPAKTAPAVAESAKTEAPIEPYQLKNRSSFSCAGDGARAPFWPIGWVHRKGGGNVAYAAPKTVLDEKSYRVTSILLGNGGTASLAVINGRAYSEGEFLRTPRITASAGGVAKPAVPAGARIRIQRIGDGVVVLQREDQTINLALQRPELAQKKADEALLDDER